MAIGARSQSARTYLDKHVDELAECSLDELVIHALRALRDTLPPDAPPLTGLNTAIGFVGKDAMPFCVVEEEAEVQAWLDKLPPPPARPAVSGELSKEDEAGKEDEADKEGEAGEMQM